MITAVVRCIGCEDTVAVGPKRAKILLGSRFTPMELRYSCPLCETVDVVGISASLAWSLRLAGAEAVHPDTQQHEEFEIFSRSSVDYINECAGEEIFHEDPQAGHGGTGGS